MMFLKKQQYKESVVPWYLISPHSKFQLRWDLCSVLLISCTLSPGADAARGSTTLSNTAFCARSIR